MEAFGPYTLYGRIGSGGMATVHLARHGDEDGWFAVKRIHAHLVDRPDVQKMFLNEAALLSQLTHPVICGVTDYSVVSDVPYLVMRYLHGISLSALITRLLTQNRPMPVNLMAYIAATICDGLHYAHEATGEDGQPLGLVHRDISPQNIFVTFGGSVHLLDFGVAKATGYETLTRTGRVKGKYAYMSPEQVSGHTVDRRSDIFSLGIVLWEALTARHLFKRRSDFDTVNAIKTAAVPAPSELNPRVPQQLDAIVARSLVADRRRRFSTAESLGQSLWRHLTALDTPVGADELSEALSRIFPAPPSPETRAMGQFTPFPGWTDPRVPAPKLPAARRPREPMSEDEAPWVDAYNEETAAEMPSGRAGAPPDLVRGQTQTGELSGPHWDEAAANSAKTELASVAATIPIMQLSPSLTARPPVHPRDEPRTARIDAMHHHPMFSEVFDPPGASQPTLTEPRNTALELNAKTQMPPDATTPTLPLWVWLCLLGIGIVFVALAIVMVA